MYKWAIGLYNKYLGTSAFHSATWWMYGRHNPDWTCFRTEHSSGWYLSSRVARGSECSIFFFGLLSILFVAWGPQRAGLTLEVPPVPSQDQCLITIVIYCRKLNQTPGDQATISCSIWETGNGSRPTLNNLLNKYRLENERTTMMSVSVSWERFLKNISLSSNGYSNFNMVSTPVIITKLYYDLL